MRFEEGTEGINEMIVQKGGKLSRLTQCRMTGD